MIEGYVITLSDNSTSWRSSDRLIGSSAHVGNTFKIHKTQAITPDRVEALMNLHQLKWNYPWNVDVLDIQSGLMKSVYKTVDPNKRIACFLSHYLLWKMCAKQKENMVVFEHDAFCIAKTNLDLLSESRYDIIALNDPRGATRKAQLYHDLTVKKGEGVNAVPSIDGAEIPQGLPGNSSYFIKPEGAQKLIDLVHEFGAWPNDAIMCRQLLPGRLGQVYPYTCRVQGIQSTTSL